MNRFDRERTPGNQLSRSLDHVLDALIDRARRAIRAPATRGAGAELRRITSLALVCREVLSHAAVRIGPAASAAEAEPAPPFGPEGAETLAREAGVTVAVVRHSLTPPGERAPEAMEQAFLLTRIGFLAAEAGRADPDGDPLAGFVWDGGAPMGRADLTGDRTATLVAARPSGPGRGLAVATVCGRRPRNDRAFDDIEDADVVLTLLVPGAPDGDDPHAWLVELRAAPSAG